MTEFGNPGGQQPSASVDDHTAAETQAQRLLQVTSDFILRRSNSLLAKAMPHKNIYYVFVTLTGHLASLYWNVLGQLSGSESLPALRRLQAIATHPFLAVGGDDAQILPESPVEASGKLHLLQGMLLSMRDGKARDRIVIISNATRTLDLVERICVSLGCPWHRLDGATPVRQRTTIVNDFNTSNTSFAFLLSSKAGGCGINLIGANRLVLMDPDWNPASDLQALACIWRLGQRRPCTIYRLFSTGTLDDKILQRQLCKTNLCGTIVDVGCLSTSVSSAMCSELFTYDATTLCATHDALGCARCSGESSAQTVDACETDLLSYAHHIGVTGVHDELLVSADALMQQGRACSGPQVSFTMSFQSATEDAEFAIHAEEAVPVGIAMHGAPTPRTGASLPAIVPLPAHRRCKIQWPAFHSAWRAQQGITFVPSFKIDCASPLRDQDVVRTGRLLQAKVSSNNGRRCTFDRQQPED